MRLLNPPAFFESAYIPEPNSGCWLWTRATEISGYGSICVGRSTTKNGNERAHRFSWRFYRGIIPEGKRVLHKCDVRSCVNPDHLFLGTDKDNYDDMVAKGRKAKFDYANSTKLSLAEVKEVRRLKQEGWRGRAIANRYGVSELLISMILLNKRREAL